MLWHKFISNLFPKHWLLHHFSFTTFLTALSSCPLLPGWILLLRPKDQTSCPQTPRPGVCSAHGLCLLVVSWGNSSLAPQGTSQSGPSRPSSTMHGLNAEHVPIWPNQNLLAYEGPCRVCMSSGLLCAMWHGLCLSCPFQRSALNASTSLYPIRSLKVNEILWLPMVLTHGFHAFLCVCVFVCCLFSFSR